MNLNENTTAHHTLDVGLTKPTTQNAKEIDQSTLTPALVATLSILGVVFILAVLVRMWNRWRKQESDDSIQNSSTRSYLYDWY
uniref:Uncharacterized protein n=1 Tax=Ciona intestinalis TaxID=7719 RepID=H2XYZ7_CIOIN